MSGFAKLNTIQFLAAINENVFKLICAYFLISLLGDHHSSTIMAVIGGLFILPFLLFSSVGGILADKCAKNRVTILTRFLEFVSLIVATVLFTYKVAWSPYIILVIMATLAALFGPSKYGIIPELLPKERLLYGNGIIASYTFFGIIIGTTLASFLLWVTQRDYTITMFFIVAIAFAGFMISLFLPKTPVENASKPIRLFIYLELFDSVKQALTIPGLFTALFAYCYFLFIGAFIQLNIIPYTVQVLHFSDIYGGYFFLISSVGLGIGSQFTSRVSKGSLKLVPLAGVGISLLLGTAAFFHDPWWLIIPWMLLLGFFGGMFLVPPQTFIMTMSPEKDRGRNFASANFFSFVFALLASLALYLLNTTLGLAPNVSFLIIGLLNLGISFLFWRDLLSSR